MVAIRRPEAELVVYNRSLLEIARHVLVVGQIGQRRVLAEHLPPKDHEAQMNLLREPVVCWVIEFGTKPARRCWKN